MTTEAESKVWLITGASSGFGLAVARRVLAAGHCAAYYPEANALVPVTSVAEISNTPTSKGVAVTIVPSVG